MSHREIDAVPSARGGNSPALRGCADGLAATIIIATLLARAQWDVVPHVIVSGWLLYTLIVSAQRCALVRQYWRASPSGTVNGRWNAAFVAGAALAAVGWGVGALVLYPADRSINEFVGVYAVGGVMLGSASLLAARPEAFLTFLLPTGLLTAVGLAIAGDEDHI